MKLFATPVVETSTVTIKRYTMENNIMARHNIFMILVPQLIHSSLHRNGKEIDSNIQLTATSSAENSCTSVQSSVIPMQKWGTAR